MRLPLVTRSIVIALFLFSLLAAAYRYLQSLEEDAPIGQRSEAHLLVVVPGQTPWYAVWTLVTAPLIETRWIPLLITTAIVTTGGRYVEKTWSSRVYADFAVTLLIGTTLAETVLSIILPRRTTMISGGNGLVAGIIVALKQMIPGHTIVFMRRRLTLQMKWLPVLFLILTTALGLAGLETNVLAYYLGFLGSWIRLRFYGVDTILRDASDAFSFAQFFPDPFASWLERPGANVYYFLAKFPLLLREPFTSEEIEDANQRHAARLSGTILPSHTRGVRITNERRKLMLRALDQ